LRVGGLAANELKDRLTQASAGRKVLIVKEDSNGVTARVFPKGGANGELARSVAEVATAQKWRVEELHTEEGRLDEVFRSITLPETVRTKEEKQ